MGYDVLQAVLCRQTSGFVQSFAGFPGEADGL